MLGGLEALRRQDGILWLGHSCFLIRLGGRTLLTDPFLSDHASPSYRLGPRRHTPPALRAHELPPVDIVLLSHAHYDHLDRPALAALPGRDRATIVTGLGMRRYLDDLGYGRVIELGWHQTAALGGLQVTAVPAIHFNRRTLTDRNLALWCGFRAETPGSKHLLRRRHGLWARLQGDRSPATPAPTSPWSRSAPTIRCR